MFYTMIQTENGDSGFNGERFVCFEADSQAEANQRAEWFGIDLTEHLPDYAGVLRWSWRPNDCGTRTPVIVRQPLEITDHPGGWVIVYKNDNIKSSFAVPITSLNIPA